MRQVFENTESTERQYGLQQRAIALGWPRDRVIVIDSDLGQSGASAVDRAGFQKLVTEVGMGRGGIVLGLWRYHVLLAIQLTGIGCLRSAPWLTR
jgi:DNA invertase Pin-like site-specific DNA recombinase